MKEKHEKHGETVPWFSHVFVCEILRELNFTLSCLHSSYNAGELSEVGLKIKSMFNAQVVTKTANALWIIICSVEDGKDWPYWEYCNNKTGLLQCHRITHSCLILIQVAKITTKLKRLTEMDKLSTTKRARFSALENWFQAHLGSHILFFSFQIRGWLQGETGSGMILLILQKHKIRTRNLFLVKHFVIKTSDKK